MNGILLGKLDETHNVNLKKKTNPWSWLPFIEYYFVCDCAKHFTLWIPFYKWGNQGLKGKTKQFPEVILPWQTLGFKARSVWLQNIPFFLCSPSADTRYQWNTSWWISALCLIWKQKAFHSEMYFIDVLFTGMSLLDADIQGESPQWQLWCALFPRAYLESDVAISEELVQKYSNSALGHVNCTIKELRRLFLVDDLVDSLKVSLLAFHFWHTQNLTSKELGVSFNLSILR